MKKYLFLILFGFFAFFPFNVFATTSNLTGDILYQQQEGTYVGSPSSYNGMPSGYQEWENDTISFPTSNYYLIKTLDTSNQLIYGIKMMTLYSGFSLTNGKFYTIRLNVDKGGYVRINDIPSIYNIQSDFGCRTNRGTCSWFWENQTMVISLNVTNANTGSWYIQLGSTSTANRAIALNVYTLGTQGFRVSSATITYDSSSSGTDLSPVINGINNTNSKLDNINNNIGELNNNQQITNDKLDDTNEKLDSIGDTLASDSVPDDSDISSQFDSFDVISNGPISSLMQIPLRVLNAIYNSVGSQTCRTYTLGTLYNTELTIPCINLEDYLGSDLFTIIDYIISVIILYNLFLLVIHFFESITSFRDFFDSLYVPKHADTGYVPKHGGDN